ncbi:MAG: EB domain-containing protein, partial [Candidatus Micrarchaeia archaeon]
MDRKHLAGGAIIILLILVFLFGGGAFGPGEEGGAGEGEGGIITCDSDEDCPGEQECVAGICKEPGTPTCEEDSDCPEGQVCIEEFCFESDEIPCEETVDCPSGYECVEGFCKEIEPAGQGPLFCSSDGDCPDGEVCQNNACMSPEEADCVEQGGEWNPETQDCTIECSDDGDCPDGEICHEGECMDPSEIPCDPPCKTGWVCVEGECLLQAELYSPNSQFGFIQAVPMSYCEGCPQEDSIVSNMFLDPDIDEKTVSAVLFVEEEFGNRTLVEDATIFIQVVPSDGSETSTCRIVTGEDGKAIFDYSEYEICDEVGCRLRFTFCCANITEGCLLPVCLSDNAISHYTDVSPCGEGPAGEWPEEAYVDGEFFNIYPAVQEISIPAQPQVIGTAFTFDLCFPVMVIFALLSAAMFATGRNPFRMFSLYTPRFKRAPMRAIRARGMTFNTTSIISGIVSASRGIGKETFDVGDKVKMLKDGMKGSKKTKDDADEAGEAAKEGRVAMADTSAVQTVGERGDTKEAGRGASGADLAPGAPQGVMSLGPDTEGLHRYGLMPDENGKGPGGGKVFGTLMGILGNAILTKILTSSPLLSWLAYGWGDFKGVTSSIREKMYDKAASEVMEWAGNALARLEFERKTDPETGEIVITHVDPASGQRMERRFDQTVEGRGEAAKYTSEIGVTPTLIIYNNSANIVLKQLSEEGSPLLEGCENAVEQMQEKFGVSVGEEISYTSASVELDHPEISEGDVPGLILRAEDLQEGGGTNLFDEEATTEWVMGLQTRAIAGEEIPQSELRLAAEVYRKGIDELGSGGLIEHSNLAHLGHVLVDATANTGMGTEIPSPDSLAFAEYAQAMVASTAAGTDPALTQKALGTLSNTHESAGAMIGESLYGVGELEPHVLKNIEECFSGEADPAKYGAALDAQRESQQLIEAQARDLVYAGVTKKGPEGREEIYDDGSIYHVI